MNIFKNMLFSLWLILFSIYLLYRLYVVKAEYKHLSFRFEKKMEHNQECKIKLFKLKNNVTAALRMEGTTMKRHFPAYITNSRPILVLRIHENNCNDCVQQTLKKLERLESKISYKIVVLAKYPSVTNVLSSFRIKFPIYISPELEQDAFAQTKPYMFVLNKYSIENVFFPDWEMPDLLNDYLDNLVVKSK